MGSGDAGQADDAARARGVDLGKADRRRLIGQPFIPGLRMLMSRPKMRGAASIASRPAPGCVRSPRSTMERN